MLTVVLSLVGGGIVGVLLERLRWSREDRVRFAPERRQAYNAFLSSIDLWERLDYEAAVNGELEDWYEAPPEDRMDPLLGAQTSTRLRPRANVAADQAHVHLTEIETSAPDAVTEKTQALRDAMRDLSTLRYSSPPRACGGASEEHNEAQEKFQTARAAFMVVVRKELRSD